MWADAVLGLGERETKYDLCLPDIWPPPCDRGSDAEVTVCPPTPSQSPCFSRDSLGLKAACPPPDPSQVYWCACPPTSPQSDWRRKPPTSQAAPVAEHQVCSPDSPGTPTYLPILDQHLTPRPDMHTGHPPLHSLCGRITGVRDVTKHGGSK